MAMKAVGRILLALTFLFGAAAFGFAQDNRAAEIQKASQTIAETRTALDAGDIQNQADYEDSLRALRLGSRGRLSAIEQDLESVRGQIDILGPAPAENDPPESDLIAEQRSQLELRRSQLNGERTRVLANIHEAGELLTRLSSAQVGALYRSLFTRGQTPVSPQLWADAWGSAKDISAQIGRYFEQWGAGRSENGALPRSLIIILVALVFSFILFGPANRWILNTFSAELEKYESSAPRKIVAAVFKMAGRTVPGIIGGLIIIETLRAHGVLTAQGENAARALWTGILSVLIVSGFTVSVFAPSSPRWRIAPIDSDQGREVSRLVLTIVVVLSIKILLLAIGDATNAGAGLLVMMKSLAAVIIGLLIIVLGGGRLWRVEGAPQTGGWRVVRRLSQALGGGIVLAALAGYTALADFVATRAVFLALILGLAWLLRAMLVESALRVRMRMSSRGPDITGQPDNYRFWSRLVVDTVLVFVVLPVALVLFGVPAATVGDFAVQSMFGFTIGGVRIPPLANLFTAIFVFVIVMVATKLIQNAVQRGPLAHSRADIGVQNSLITLLGYAGLVIALVMSVSALGFDLGNLALIAGALSVGIGFGLQSIVNNFVSGLILLFERPIKVGDWVVTPSGEGTVKRISVRSTEIETFDRSSIIVPNSELISSTVTNWTHKNRIGRIRVPVGVAYSSDPDQVKEILLKCARDHPLVVSFPEPFIVWNDFGASSLDFELRAFLGDISQGLQVRTDLRFAIFKAFREAGVEIPFPQQDVYVKAFPDKDFHPSDDRQGEIT